uniref:NAD-dependent protein deacylase ) n=1 Tax=Ganoderma boninense TaxID=34458 RepID=A0A5K1JSJ5_9APHY|nr:NAD-dependent protein deacylase (EC (Regulatory protein SIR2 homolog) [Ganoderma boninense]
MQQSAPSTTLDNDIEAFRAVLARSKRIVVLAGDGLSVASGMTTWRGHDVFKLSTKAAFIDDPSRIWQYNHYLRTVMLTASPNAAHLALARLSLPSSSSRRALAPHATAFTLLTQNIDGLDRRAIDRAYADAGLPSPLRDSDDSESTQQDPLLLEMHGHVAGVRCTDYACRHRALDLTTPLCPALAGTELVVDAPLPAPLPSLPSPRPPHPKRIAAEARAWAAARFAWVAQEADGEGEPEIAVRDLPRCAQCGSLLRPDIVWFTEAPHRIAEAVRVVERADVIMVVGTSALVHPAATFAATVKERGGTVAVFNVERSDRDGLADFVFLGPCEEILLKVLDLGESS